jgi:hypothetical protein
LEVDVQQGNFKILQLLPQVFIFFLVEKWIPPTMLETAEIGKKTEGILGVKPSQPCARIWSSRSRSNLISYVVYLKPCFVWTS